MRFVGVDGEGGEWGVRGGGDEVRVMRGELEGGMERVVGATDWTISTGESAL